MEEMLLHVMCATQGLFLNSKGEPTLWQWLGCGCTHEGTLRGKPGPLAGETLGAGKTSSVELPNNLAVLLFLVYEKESDLLYWDHYNIGVSWLGKFILKECGILVPILQMEEAGITRMKGPVQVHAAQSKNLSLWLLDSKDSAISFIDSFIQHRFNSCVIEASVRWLCLNWRP